MFKNITLIKQLSLLFIILISFSLVACTEPNELVAEDVIEMIDGLPEEVKLEDGILVERARISYESLTDIQKEQVTNLEELITRELILVDLRAAHSAISKISFIPTNLVLAHEKLVIDAREVYDNITPAQKELVTNYNRLVESERIIEELKVDKENKEVAIVVELMIRSLPNIVDIRLKDEESIVIARAAYEELTVPQKELILNLRRLIDSENKIEQLKAEEKLRSDKFAAKVVNDMIDALPSTVLLEHENQIITARNAYEKLTENQKIYVTSLSLLIDKEEKIAKLKLAKPVEDLINKLPDEVTLEDESDIITAREAYDALEDDIKSLVPNYETLVQKENDLLDLKNTDE